MINTPAAIRLHGVDYRASKEFAIRDLAMSVPRGAVYGFLGPNGSGKTTAIRLLLGMLRADAGIVEVLGHDISRDAHSALAKIGYVPERSHLWPHLTVEETMRLHAAFFPPLGCRARGLAASAVLASPIATRERTLHGRERQADDAARALDTTRVVGAR